MESTEPAMWKKKTARVIWIASWMGGVYLMYQVVSYWRGEITSPLVDQLASMYPLPMVSDGVLSSLFGAVGSFAYFVLGLVSWVMAGGLVTHAGYSAGQILTLGWPEYQRRVREAEAAAFERAKVEDVRRKRRELREKARRGKDSGFVYFVVGVMLGGALF